MPIGSAISSDTRIKYAVLTSDPRIPPPGVLINIVVSFAAD